jgi:predicted metal-dependent peptidase
MIISKLQKARAVLVMDHPFFASLLFGLPMVESREIPTMATDGVTFLYNPDWMDTLSQSEIIFVLAHETLHCVYKHMTRRESRDPMRWNIAADYIINDVLVRDNVGTMPKGALLDAALVQRGKGTAEGVYSLLPDNAGKGKKPGDKGGPLDDIQAPGKSSGGSGDPAEVKKLEEDWNIKTRQAHRAAEMCGKMPGAIKSMIEKLTKSRVDWREVLRRFISERAKLDHSFAKPKRRYNGEDFILPSLQGERMGSIVVAVDCSGSVNPDLLTAFCSELNAIRENLKPETLEVIYFDSRVIETQSFTESDPLELKHLGGGGTAFSPIFKQVEKMDVPPVCVVVLTDLECDDFGASPACPVLWCVLEGSRKLTAPFGEIVEVSNGV